MAGDQFLTINLEKGHELRMTDLPGTSMIQT